MLLYFVLLLNPS